MLKHFKSYTTKSSHRGKLFLENHNICQSDYPVDWYQEEFIPYAKEYLALPNRKSNTVIAWLESYVRTPLNYFKDSLLLLGHYYMGGEIVHLIKQFGGKINDSYQLAKVALQNPQATIIVESAVHFMAETSAILANSKQKIYITNPKSGCSMEMYAKDYMVLPALTALNRRYGRENILPICYMNSSGRIKALVGHQGGVICTSSNVDKIFRWGLNQKKKIFFLPDKNMGLNAAAKLNISLDKIAIWPSGKEAIDFNLMSLNKKRLNHFDRAKVIIFASICKVHDFFTTEMVDYWQKKGFWVLVHPECAPDVFMKADGSGSTASMHNIVQNDLAKTKKYAIGTENHFVENLKREVAPLKIQVFNLAAIPFGTSDFRLQGCGCATMSRNDPPHLAALLDLLYHKKVPELNLVKPGDIVNEFTGERTRLEDKGQQWIQDNGKIALANMIAITER